MINRTNLTNILVAGAIALTSNQVLANQTHTKACSENGVYVQCDKIRYNTDTTKENYAMENVVRDMIWSTSQIESWTEKSNNWKRAAINMFQGYSDSDYKSANNLMKNINGGIMNLKNDVRMYNDKTKPFYSKKLVDQVCETEKYSKSKPCLEKKVVIHPEYGDEYYKLQAITVNFDGFKVDNIPQEFTIQKNKQTALYKLEEEKMAKIRQIKHIAELRQYAIDNNSTPNLEDYQDKGPIPMRGKNTFACLTSISNLYDNLPISEAYKTKNQSIKEYDRIRANLNSLNREYNKLEYDNNNSIGLNLTHAKRTGKKAKLAKYQELQRLNEERRNQIIRVLIPQEQEIVDNSVNTYSQEFDKLEKEVHNGIESFNQTNVCLGKKMTYHTIDTFCKANSDKYCKEIKNMSNIIDKSSGNTGRFIIDKVPQIDFTGFTPNN